MRSAVKIPAPLAVQKLRARRRQRESITRSEEAIRMIEAQRRANAETAAKRNEIGYVAIPTLAGPFLIAMPKAVADEINAPYGGLEGAFTHHRQRNEALLKQALEDAERIKQERLRREAVERGKNRFTWILLVASAAIVAWWLK